MSSVTINELTVPQLIAMADGLLEKGEVGLARQLYAKGLREAGVADRQRLRTRLGLAGSPGPRTLGLLAFLRRLESENLFDPFVSDGLATWHKTLPFAEDPRFLELADAHANLLPIPNWHWNLLTALWAVQSCRETPGDYVELGVFKGHTTLFCSEYVEFEKWPKTWWLYDTFDGIPDDQLSPGWELSNKAHYKNTFSFEEVRDRFAHISNIKVIQGRVPEILLEGAPDKIAFMHVDLNNAPAEIGALDLLFERVSSGGMILFDDYCWASARVQYDAENAWFAERGLKILPLATGQGLFVKR